MYIQILSDIHTEFGSNICDFLNDRVGLTIIAGDLGTSKNIVDELIRIDDYINHPIIFVPGNHEYYHSQKSIVDNILDGIEFKNVIILNNNVVILDDIVFIGGTGWFESVTPFALSRMSDFDLIRDINENGNGRYWNKTCYNFFNSSLKRYKGNKIICITHNIPSYSLVHKMYKKPPYSGMNCCFAMPWDNLIKKYSPDVWVYGHTHTSNNSTIYKTRVICNPYGYHMRDVNKGFNKNVVIEKI